MSSLLPGLASAALLMGLGGAPHCVAMCGSTCGGVVGAAHCPRRRAMGWFQVGRLTGYATVGAVVGELAHAAAWLGDQTAVLRPLWVLSSLLSLAWGLTLLAMAREPLALIGAGPGWWQRARPLLAGRGGVFTAGLCWALLPCGLLYSAYLLAGLSGSAPGGAMVMSLFALGGAVPMALFPDAMQRLRRWGDRRWQGDAGTRLAGGLLAALSLWAILANVGDHLAAWCRVG